MGKEIITAIIFILFLIFFWNPFQLWMPEVIVYMVVGGLFVFIAIYAGLILREKPRDEREEKHRASAGRIGFLSGVVILAVAIAFQSFSSHPDPWLIGALGAMIISKLLALSWKGHSE